MKPVAKAPAKAAAKAPVTAVPAAKPAPAAVPPRAAEAAKPALPKPATGNGMVARAANTNLRHGERPEPPIAPSKMSAKMAKAQEKLFSPGDYVVYPTHGVGQIIGVEDQTVAGLSLRVFAISFESEKMILRVPVEKAKQAGLRAISTRKEMQTALATLKGRARIKRVIWSRRAQEYEAKINSGSPTSIAEVVRDLHRATGQPDQSYSERQIYEAALDRLARELALVEDIDQPTAAKRVEKMLRAA
ncbi:MAG: CarD family transcriptional regulator [Alphaproteobacteria bacterium]